MQAKPKRTPGRQPSVTEAARRAQIVDAAIDVLAERGFAGTSFARIAERAGLSSTGLISYHFSSKEDLLEQVVTTIYRRGAEELVPRIAAAGGPREMLRTYIEENLVWVARHRREVSAVIEVTSNLRTEDGRLRFDAASDAATLAGTESILARGQADGVFRAFDVRSVALAIRSVIDRAPMLFAAFPSLDPEAYARDVADLLDAATRKAPPTTQQRERRR